MSPWKTIVWSALTFSIMFYHCLSMSSRVVLRVVKKNRHHSCETSGGKSDAVMMWKHFPRYWPFVWRIQWSPVDSKKPVTRIFGFSLMYTFTLDWTNDGIVGDLRNDIHVTSLYDWANGTVAVQLPPTHQNGPLARYIKLRVAHAPGMPGTFSPPPTSKETVS